MPSSQSLGSRGEEVTELQNQLIAAGYGSLLPNGANGDFDEATQNALQAFQTAAGISEKQNVGTTLSVGSEVTFRGGSVYVSSDAENPSASRGSSKVKITIVNDKYGPHSVHAVSTDCSYGDPNYVYGWVNPSDLDLSGGAMCGPKTWEALRKVQQPDPPKPEIAVVDAAIAIISKVLSPSDPADIFIMNLVTGTRIDIPATPSEVSDSVSVNYESETPRGRSVGYTGYTNTENKTVSFSVRLFGELIDDPIRGDSQNNLESIVNKLKALEYPKYQSGVVIPPNCYVNLYKGLKFSALCTSVDVVWGGPIKQSGYTYADVSLTFRNVVDSPYQAVVVEVSGNNG